MSAADNRPASKPTPLETWMRLASKAIPLLPLGPFGVLAGELADLGLDALERRALLAAATATPEQLEYFDAQNGISVIDKIREQGKDI